MCKVVIRVVNDQSHFRVVSLKIFVLGSKLSDLETVLHLLSAPNVKKLCKDVNVGAKGNQKQEIIDALISHSKKKSFFATSSNHIASIILKKYGYYFKEVLKITKLVYSNF